MGDEKAEANAPTNPDVEHSQLQPNQDLLRFMGIDRRSPNRSEKRLPNVDDDVPGTDFP